VPAKALHFNPKNIMWHGQMYAKPAHHIKYSIARVIYVHHLSAGNPWWRAPVWHCHILDSQAAQGSCKGDYEQLAAGQALCERLCLCTRGHTSYYTQSS